MIDASWLVFVVASLVLIATPGQDMILVMSRSVAQGASAGVVTAAGVSVGLVGHTVLATLGLGAILRTSEWLFIALKLVGAAYLVYLGIGLAAYEAKRFADRDATGPRSAQAFRRWRGFQSVQSQDRDLLLCLPAAIRRTGGRISDAHGVRPRARVCGPDVSGQSAGWHLRREALGLAAFSAGRADVGVSIVGRNPGRLGHKACIRAALTAAAEASTDEARRESALSSSWR